MGGVGAIIIGDIAINMRQTSYEKRCHFAPLADHLDWTRHDGSLQYVNLDGRREWEDLDRRDPDH